MRTGREKDRLTVMLACLGDGWKLPPYALDGIEDDILWQDKDDANPFQGSYRSWKTWKVMEFKNFIFQAWKVMEFYGQSWKVMENCKCRW